MIETKTVLILGAGASFPYQFPIGTGLRNSILAQDPDSIEWILNVSNGTSMSSGLGRSFIQAFRDSNVPSIDSFLARRSEYSLVGRNAIAAAILPCEQRMAKTKSLEVAGDWYKYLLAKMDSTWEKFTSNQISIITFNYDRSLEFYLSKALAAIHSKSFEEAIKAVESLEIVHVYGKLGSLDPDSPEFLPFGGFEDKRHSFQLASHRLRVIPEGRNDSPEISKARALISDCDHLGILGFGFDETNVERLGGGNICSGRHLEATGRKPWTRALAVSCVEVTEAEKAKAFFQISGTIGGPSTSQFFDGDCLHTLRSSLILG